MEIHVPFLLPRSHRSALHPGRESNRVGRGDPGCKRVARMRLCQRRRPEGSRLQAEPLAAPAPFGVVPRSGSPDPPRDAGMSAIGTLGEVQANVRRARALLGPVAFLVVKSATLGKLAHADEGVQGYIVTVDPLGKKNIPMASAGGKKRP
jgi:hypothetical protein